MEEKLKRLNEVKRLYKDKKNIMSHLKSGNEDKRNTTSDIQISYDFQAGSYIEHYYLNQERKDKFYEFLAQTIDQLGSFETLLEAGVGEAVTLGNLLKRLSFPLTDVYGLDLSWSRIKYGQQFLRDNQINNVQLFTGDMFCMPVKDSSIDLVYTVHAIEPNGGREKEALSELFRIARKYIILLEPAYELADEKARERMRSHGYITNLHATAIEMGLNIVEYRLFDVSLNRLNPTAVMIIKKDSNSESSYNSPLCCPITKRPFTIMDDTYYTEEGMLAYPVLRGVPCLLAKNAIVATHLMDFPMNE